MISASATILLGVIAAANVQLYEFTADWCGSCQQMKPTVTQVANAGVEVTQVAFDQNRELAKQAGVDRIPTFLVVHDGEIVDRIVGAASYDRLMNAVERAQQAADLQDAQRAVPQVKAPQYSPRNSASPHTFGLSRAPIVRGQHERKQGIGDSLAKLMDNLRPSGSSPLSNPFASKAKSTDSPNSSATSVSPASFQSELPSVPARTPSTFESGNNNPTTKSSNAAVDHAMAATVRIRVHDAEGASLGTGTIIDIHEDEALILTCGHIFDDSKGKGRITCDLAGGTGRKDLPAKLISYDSRRDVGLVSVRPGEKVLPVPVGGPGSRTREHDKVFTIGCSHGEVATINHNQVLAVNRYHGAANLVVGGRPVNGRSGGGLFNAAGELIGVCNAADQKEDEGLYAALGPVHAELDSAGLGFIYRDRNGNEGMSKLTAAASGNSGNSDTSAIAKSSLFADPARLAPRTSPPAAAGIAAPTTNTSPDRETEVICIVRPKNDRANAGKAFVIDRPSPELINKLSEELARRGEHAMTGARQ